MKHFFIALAIALMAAMAVEASDITEASDLAKRISPRLAQKVTFKLIPSTTGGHDVFTLESQGSKVVIALTATARPRCRGMATLPLTCPLPYPMCQPGKLLRPECHSVSS